MALDQLLAALEREALRTAEQLVADAHAEAARITAEAERQVEQRRATALATAEQGQRAALERTVADAARASRHETLAEREALLARLFTAVRSALPQAIAQPAYLESLPARLAAAQACFEEGQPLVLRCSESLRATLQALIAPQPGITVEPIAGPGTGFLLASADGAMEVDTTLETGLEAARMRLARTALRQLELIP
jgi:vacuolar-type H+-ATPase subunit E/Vma4